MLEGSMPALYVEGSNWHRSTLAIQIHGHIIVNMWNHLQSATSQALHLSTGLVVLCTFVKQMLVHLHEQLQRVVYVSVYRPATILLPTEQRQFHNVCGRMAVTTCGTGLMSHSTHYWPFRVMIFPAKLLNAWMVQGTLNLALSYPYKRNNPEDNNLSNKKWNY